MFSDAELAKQYAELFFETLRGELLRHFEKIVFPAIIKQIQERTIRDAQIRLPSEEEARKFATEFHGGMDYEDGFLSCYDWIRSQIKTAEPTTHLLEIKNVGDQPVIITNIPAPISDEELGKVCEQYCLNAFNSVDPVYMFKSAWRAAEKFHGIGENLNKQERE